MFPTSPRPLRALAAASIFLIPGCRDATAPPAAGVTSAALASSPNAAPTETHVALARAVPLRTSVSASALITPEGGVLALPAAGLRMTFPAGAVAAPVTVRARTSSVGRIAYEFEPHGLTFAAPVLVEQAIANEASRGLPAGLVATYVATGYVDRRDGLLSADEVLAVRLSTDSRTATFLVTHFSGYQLASGRKK